MEDSISSIDSSLVPNNIHRRLEPHEQALSHENTSVCWLIALERRIEQALRVFQVEWPETCVEERSNHTVQFALPHVSTNLSNLFEYLEENMTRLGISEYSISQNTLDQLFHKISQVRDQDPRLWQSQGLDHDNSNLV